MHGIQRDVGFTVNVLQSMDWSSRWGATRLGLLEAMKELAQTNVDLLQELMILENGAVSKPVSLVTDNAVACESITGLPGHTEDLTTQVLFQGKVLRGNNHINSSHNDIIDGIIRRGTKWIGLNGKRTELWVGLNGKRADLGARTVGGAIGVLGGSTRVGVG